MWLPNVDINKSLNLELLLSAEDFTKFLAMEDWRHNELHKAVWRNRFSFAKSTVPSKSPKFWVLFVSMFKATPSKHFHWFKRFSKFQWSAWLGVPRAGPVLCNYLAPPYSRRINTTPERQCVTCVINFWILIISIHTSRFGNRIK